MRTRQPRRSLTALFRQFQFPPNGKAHANDKQYDLAGHFIHQFQFPPNGKAHANKAEVAKFVRFNEQFQFPPNGKAHANEQSSQNSGSETDEFQFPPNGKAHANKGQTQQESGLPNVSIPSKREGTCEPPTVLKGSARTSCFNSLQTGRHMRTTTSR